MAEETPMEKAATASSFVFLALNAFCCSWCGIVLIIILFVGLFVSLGMMGGNNQAIAGPDCLSPAGGSVTILDENLLAEGFGKYIEFYASQDSRPLLFTPDMGRDFVQAAKQAGINPLTLIGEAVTESSLGREPIVCSGGVATYNAYGRTATSSQPGCKTSAGSEKTWYMYPNTRDGLYQQAQYVYSRYVNPETCPECKEKGGPLSFNEYLEIYSPAGDDNDHSSMTQRYNAPAKWLKENGYGSAYACGVGSPESLQSSTTSTTAPDSPL